MNINACDVSENMELLFEIVGSEKFLEIAKMYGGNNLYIPTYKSVVRGNRNREIVKRYNGVNSMQLANEYSLSVNQIKQIVNEGV